MSLISTVEKILCKEDIEWNDVRSIVPKCSIVLIDKLLLGVMKCKDTPRDVVDMLVSKARLKTVRKAFDKACFQDRISNDMLDNLLNALEPLRPEIIELCLRSCLRSSRFEVANRLIHQDQDFLSSNFATGAFEDETDFHLLADMLLKTDIIRYKKDMVCKGMIHQFVSGPDRSDVVSIILDDFPYTVKMLDQIGKLPLHYALESKNFSSASILIEKGIQEGMHLGGLLKECDKLSISPLTCALELKFEKNEDVTSILSAHIRNVVEWLLTLKLLQDDACVTCGIIKYSLMHGLVDVATDVYNLSLELNVPNIEDKVSKSFQEVADDLIARSAFESHVSFIHINKFKATSGLWYGEDSCYDDASSVRAEAFYQKEIQLNGKFSSWLDDIFHKLISKNHIECVRLLLRSHPALLCCPNSVGASPIHTASLINDCFSMVVLLFEEAMHSDVFPLKHGGIFAGYCHHVWGKFIPDPPFCKFFSSLDDNELDCLRRLIDIDPSLPFIPYALFVRYPVNDSFFLHSTLRWDPLSQFNGMHALFYALQAIYEGIITSDAITLVQFCLDSNSEWHKCVHTRNCKGELPLHFLLCLKDTFGTCIHSTLRKFITHPCNMKHLYELDKKYGLYPALLVASYGDVSTTYELLLLNVHMITQNFERTS